MFHPHPSPTGPLPGHTPLTRFTCARPFRCTKGAEYLAHSGYVADAGIDVWEG